ncbi:MAG: hypothetical protein H0U52_05305 [Chloroflexi bacterium]|nr:hypothetical protein [Chloroflexota bacterium]
MEQSAQVEPVADLAEKFVQEIEQKIDEERLVRWRPRMVDTGRKSESFNQSRPSEIVLFVESQIQELVETG